MTSPRQLDAVSETRRALKSTGSNTLAYIVMVLAVLVGGGSMLALGVFVYVGRVSPTQTHGSNAKSLWIDALLSMVFFLQHSGMVRTTFRQWLTRFIPEEYGGAFYAIVSGAVLLAVVSLWQTTPLLFKATGLFWWVLRALGWLSFFGFIWAASALRGFDFFGLRPILGRSGEKESKPTAFVFRGPYRWVRHPVYFFLIVLCWTCPVVTADRLLFDVLWTAWVVMGAILEERDLVAAFGDAYREYQRKVPMLIPYRMG